MDIAVYIIIGLAAGGFATWLAAARQRSAAERKAAESIGRLEKRLAETLAKTELLEQTARKYDDAKAESTRLAAQCAALRKEAEMLKAQNAEESALRERRFAEQLQTTREQLANTARAVMESNAQRLKEQNGENIGHITQPLKDAISDMRRALDDNARGNAESHASLREQIRLIMESSRSIGEKADALVNVLRHDNKASGTMGEIILGDLLAAQGLTEGTHYEVQARLRDAAGRAVRNDDTGQEMQPDVILHYPQGQDAIIDSKVSLTAYERYVNTDDEAEKAKHLQEHIRSVRQHVGELARKDYSRYVKAPRKAIDFVIMFVPFESSLQLALSSDPTLWREAFEKKVFITGEQNLMAILHMIHIAWVQDLQAENQKKVFDTAATLLERVGDFIKRYDELGDRLAKTVKAYEETGRKLNTGNQSVVKKARELIELGAKENPNKRIPQAD